MIQLSSCGSAHAKSFSFSSFCYVVHVRISHVCQVRLKNIVVDTIPGKFPVDVEDFYELR